MTQRQRQEGIVGMMDRLEAAVREGDDQARRDARNQIWNQKEVEDFLAWLRKHPWRWWSE